MIKPTSKSINIISILITMIICIVLNLLNNYWLERDRMNLKINFQSPELIEQTTEAKLEEDIEDIEDKNTESLKNYDESPVDKNKNLEGDWTIEIPEINLKAPIHEGTLKEVMNEFVGHFEETQIENGNIGLAAHNRGYPVNYFQDIKKLKEGSIIIYKHSKFVMTYIVKTVEIIENTNWEYLKNTEDNRITLITCVENEPKYRRCIQGVEKEESEEV